MFEPRMLCVLSVSVSLHMGGLVSHGRRPILLCGVHLTHHLAPARPPLIDWHGGRFGVANESSLGLAMRMVDPATGQVVQPACGLHVCRLDIEGTCLRPLPPPPPSPLVVQCCLCALGVAGGWLCALLCM